MTYSKILIASLAAGLAVVQAQAAILIDNDFGAGADTGPAFQQIGNGAAGGGTADPLTGLVTLNNHTDPWANYGFNNPTAVDVTSVSGATGFTVNWTVSSMDIATQGRIDENGLFFGVVGGNNATGTAGNSLFTNDPESIGLVLRSGNFGNMQLYQGSAADASSSLTALGAAAPTIASLEDGFTISLTVNDDNTWSASTTGLSDDVSASGTLTIGNSLYADIADNLGAYASVQGEGLTMTVDHVTVTTVPEPASIGMLMGLGAGLMLVRRRRK